MTRARRRRSCATLVQVNGVGSVASAAQVSPTPPTKHHDCAEAGFCAEGPAHVLLSPSQGPNHQFACGHKGCRPAYKKLHELKINIHFVGWGPNGAVLCSIWFHNQVGIVQSLRRGSAESRRVFSLTGDSGRDFLFNFLIF